MATEEADGLGKYGTIEIDGVARVCRVGFGGAWLTGSGTFGPPPDLKEACRVVRTAREAGVQLFDTADCYGPATSEKVIAEALHPYPDDVVISSKGGRIALGDNQWRANGRPEHLKQACEGSLRRLRLDRIDLYQLNAVDPEVPLAESLGALIELRDAGKIGAIGLCNVDTEQLKAALEITPIASVQDRFDPENRDNMPVLELCVTLDIAFLSWFPPTTSVTAIPWMLETSPVTVPLPGSPELAGYREMLAALA